MSNLNAACMTAQKASHRAKAILLTLHSFIRLLFAGTLLFLTHATYAETRNGDSYTLASDRLTLAITSSGDIASITSRYKQTHGNFATKTFSAGDSLPLFSIVDGSPVKIPHTPPRLKTTDTTSSITFSFDNSAIEYTIHNNSYLIQTEIRTSGSSFSTPILRAVLPIDKFNKQTSVALINNKQQSISSGIKLRDSSCWFGVRDNFWALLIAKPPSELSASSRSLIADLPMLKSASVKHTVYAGPIEYHELQHVDATLTHLLYPLWFWMRWLSFGLLQLFSLLLKVSGNTIFSIFLLSISVKLILAPLYHFAHKLQQSVNRQKSLIAPRLADIQKSYKGELQTRKTLELYKEFGISPLYELKSLASAAIQIPVFFAAYHMLSEHIALSGIPFLWIQDISKPDALFTLPFSVVYFGHTFNMLPFIMTSITVLASSIHSDTSLSSQLHRKQRTSLLLMAALFFLLLYPSAAGMLLYWTMNNILSLLSTVSSRFLRPLHPPLTGAKQS